jgi:hypothetical protein
MLTKQVLYSRNVSFSDNYADEHVEKIVSDMHNNAKEDTEQIASEKYNVADEGHDSDMQVVVSRNIDQNNAPSTKKAHKEGIDDK